MSQRATMDEGGHEAISAGLAVFDPNNAVPIHFKHEQCLSGNLLRVLFRANGSRLKRTHIYSVSERLISSRGYEECLYELGVQHGEYLARMDYGEFEGVEIVEFPHTWLDPSDGIRKNSGGGSLFKKFPGKERLRGLSPEEEDIYRSLSGRPKPRDKYPAPVFQPNGDISFVHDQALMDYVRAMQSPFVENVSDTAEIAAFYQGKEDFGLF